LTPIFVTLGIRAGVPLLPSTACCETARVPKPGGFAFGATMTDAPDPDFDPMDPPEPAVAPVVEQQGLLSWEEHLEAYKHMGPGRSFTKLCAMLKKMGKRPRAVQSLKTYSAKNGWQVHIHEFDQQVTREADKIRKNTMAKEQAADMQSLAGKMRDVAHKAIRRLNMRVDTLKLKSGGEWKAVADAVVALNKAAEVLDGGVSDRTEKVSTTEERKTKALDIVNNAFAQINKTGQDNAKRTAKSNGEPEVGDAGDARTGTTGV